MRSMDSELVRAYRECWEALAALEAEERRTASVALRWRQLNAILHMSRELKLRPSARRAGVEAVRRRWIRLKQLQP